MVSAEFTFAKALGQAEIHDPIFTMEVYNARKLYGMGSGAHRRALVGSKGKVPGGGPGDKAQETVRLMAF